jgi:hypothetical protein
MHIRAGAKGSVGFVIFKEKLFPETLDLQTSRVSEAKSLPPDVRIGHSLPKRVVRATSALLLIADFCRKDQHVSKVPQADINPHSITSSASGLFARISS